MQRLWIALTVVVVFGFAVLAWIGTRIYQEMPPIPARVVTSTGDVLISPGEIMRGQHVWQTMGGMEVGSVWGHGSYVAPDWTAEWLHRESEHILNAWATVEQGRAFAEIGAEAQGALQARLRLLMRTNNYDSTAGTLTIAPVRAEAFDANARHYAQIFRDGQANYAIPAGTIADAERLHALAAFFFWSAWAAAAERPGTNISYTSNWPHEPLVGNVPTGETVVWTGVSIIMLLAGLGGFIWYYAARPEPAPADNVPAHDPLLEWIPTASQRATIKFFVVVAALFLLQILTGAITAHYGVEGDGLYGIPLSRVLPYSITRTWHLQLGLFWIATSWLAAGLFIAPLVGGREPPRQRLGVNVLFAALVLVVGGSMGGEYLSIHNHLTDRVAFYLGHQGYEYLDLGRIWQAALFVGLLLWLLLMLRAIGPALRTRGEHRPLVLIFALSAGVDRALLRRWFDVRQTDPPQHGRVLALVGCTPLGGRLLRGLRHHRHRLSVRAPAAHPPTARCRGLADGGDHLPCRRYHWHLSPSLLFRHADRRACLGRSVSALEVVPLLLVGYSATHDLRTSRLAEWARKYRWPVYFFLAVAFWNMVGAGLFGFMVNPPIALYYMQGLNTTAVHAHGALFGVYGMLGLGLTLVCLRALTVDRQWREGLLAFGFWAMNLGLMGMMMLSLLPVGLLQTWASVQHGYWYARSPEFLDGGGCRRCAGCACPATRCSRSGPSR